MASNIKFSDESSDTLLIGELALILSFRNDPTEPIKALFCLLRPTFVKIKIVKDDQSCPLLPLPSNFIKKGRIRYRSLCELRLTFTYFQESPNSTRIYPKPYQLKILLVIISPQV